MKPKASVHRLLPDALVCERGAKDKLLWSIPEDASFICAWFDPVDENTYLIASDGMTGMMRDHLTMALIRKGVENRG